MIDDYAEAGKYFPYSINSCKAFMEFLEKSLPLPSRDEGRIKASKNAKIAEKKPERPRWETSKPLGAIKPNRHESSGMF